MPNTDVQHARTLIHAVIHKHTCGGKCSASGGHSWCLLLIRGLELPSQVLPATEKQHFTPHKIKNKSCQKRLLRHRAGFWKLRDPVLIGEDVYTPRQKGPNYSSKQKSL